MLEVGESPTLCRNGKTASKVKSDTAIKVSRAGATAYDSIPCICLSDRGLPSMAVAAAEQVSHHLSEQSSQERFEFFDINASVDKMRFDIITHGYVLPETKQQVYDEEMTYVAEGINRPLYTKFEYAEQDGQMMYFSNGAWRPYMQLLYNGLRSTEELAAKDPRKQFLHDMSVNDLANGYAMQKLQPGEALSWYSPYRDDIERQYGAEFLEDCGFQPQRRMGFLYRASKQADGTVVLESHSVDSSLEAGFSAAMQAAANPETDMETMVWAYDTALQKETGIVHSAGRQTTSGQKEQNVWYAMRQHDDLVGMYFTDLEKLAHTFLPREQTEQQKKRLTIGFWAAIKARIDRPVTMSEQMPQGTDFTVSAAQREAQLRAEITIAYQRAASKGEVLIGCGGSMKALSGSFDSMGLEDAFESLFGKDTKNDDGGESDDQGPLVFKCTEGHTNRRPRGKLLTSCQTKPCKPGSVGC